MANATAKKIILDGPRNAVVLFTGILDTSNATLAGVLALSDLTGDPARTEKGLRIDKIQYSISSQLTVQLYWNATADQIIVPLCGQGEFCFTEAGGLLPNSGAGGFDGALDLTTLGWASGVQTYAILVHMTKLYS